jgi:iron complex transport system ATP-binding protein
MLSIENLSVSINQRIILDSINMTVEPGSIYSIVGPNGAGKSTLLRALVGLVSSMTGVINYQGEDLSRLSSKKRAQVLAYLPQSLPGNQQFPVHEFIALGNYPWNDVDDPAEIQKRIDQALDICQIAEFRNRRISTLSGGERQRVYLAQVIVQRTPIILLDEPTVFLDLKHQILFEEILLQLKNENKIIIYVSHDLHSARRIASHIAALKDGSILTHGCPETVLNPTLIAKMFDTETEVVRQWYGNGWGMPS